MECVEYGPGTLNAFAPERARGIIVALRSAGLGIDAEGKLFEIEKALERWFSPRKWAGRDNGQSSRRDLYALLAGLNGYVETWYATRP